MTGRRLHCAALCAATLAATAASAAGLDTLKSFCAAGGTQCTDGAGPGGLVRDASGALYGTTYGGGAYREGTVFSLVPNADSSQWTYRVLRSFCPRVGDCSGGAGPVGTLVIDTDGNFYGVTTFGGRGAQSASPGFGTIFKLTHDANYKKWSLAPFYKFCVQRNCTDGEHPEAGLAYAGQAAGLPFDGTSPLYGTTFSGGAHGKGTVFEVTLENGYAIRRTIYDFCSAASCADGSGPGASLTVDANGNIVGTAAFGGGHEAGVIFRLTRGSGDTWTQTVLHDFDSPPGNPDSGVLIDGAGNMFGTAGNGFNAVLYRLSGSQYTVLHTFCQLDKCADGGAPRGDLTMDSSGNLIGVTEAGGVNGKKNGGTVFRYSGGGEYSLLYSFCAQRNCKDGNHPVAGVTLDVDGNLFGTTGDVGQNGSGGTVFRLMP